MTIEELIEAAEKSPKGEVDELNAIVAEAHQRLGELEKVAPLLREVIKVARQNGATK